MSYDALTHLAMMHAPDDDGECMECGNTFPCNTYHAVARGLSARQAESRVSEHDRDRDGICRRCGHGLTAIDIVDGEKPCQQQGDPYADCRCGHGRSTHVHYTGACGLCACSAVREPGD